MYLCPGQRIELVAMPDDPDPIQPGTRGTVRSVGNGSVGQQGYGRPSRVQVEVEWDNGQSLMLYVPPDRYRVVED